MSHVLLVITPDYTSNASDLQNAMWHGHIPEGAEKVCDVFNVSYTI